MTHNTIPFQVKNPLQSMLGLSRAMALPHEYAPQRFPSFPALERTAVMGFNTPTVLTVPAKATRMALYRQAAYPLWADQALDGAYVWSFDFSTTGGLDAFSTLTAPTAVSGTLRTGNPATYNAKNLINNNPSSTINITTAGANTSAAFTKPLMAVDSSCGPTPFIYVPVGASLGAMMNTGQTMTPGDLGRIVIEVWTAPGNVVTTTWTSDAYSGTNFQLIFSNGSAQLGGQWVRPITLTGSAGTYTKQQWMSMVIYDYPAGSTYTAVGSLDGAITFSFALPLSGLPTSTPFLPLSYPKEFDTTPVPWMSTRLTAVSVLATNVTKIMNKEGTVLCGRLNPQTTPPFLFSSNDIVGLHPAEKQQLALETGAYTYCPPSTDMADFLDYALECKYIGYPTTQNRGYIPLFRLDSSALYNALVFSDSDGGTSLSINLDWHIEFRTTSSLWQIGMSTIALEQLHQAQISLVSAGFFFCNWDHKKLLSQITGALVKTGNALMPMLSMAHPGVNAAVKLGTHLLSAKPKAAPQATTASKAGWNGPPKPSKSKPKAKPKAKARR